MSPRISVVIPNFNGERTIRSCLEAVFASIYKDFEVVVVDDFSADGSVRIIERFPCSLVRFDRHSGAARARNVGALHSKGDVLFFTDADCLLMNDTLSRVNTLYETDGCADITGGTYTLRPHDKGFLSVYQSVYINYAETKNPDGPDYVASHAMAIRADLFRETGGFREDFMPIIEDVEFSHRVRHMGHTLRISPQILVRHVFNFTIVSSLRNAFRKSLYWTVYSIVNRDLLTDSGAASAELKVNVVSFAVAALGLLLGPPLGSPLLPAVAVPVVFLNIFTSRRLFKAFYRAEGMVFALKACAYYLCVYPIPVGLGGIAGVFSYVLKYRKRPR